MMPSQQPPQPPPAWSMTIPPPRAEGVHPPTAPISIKGALTDADLDGHSWAILEISDGTVTASIRLPWQHCDGVGMAIAQIMAQVKQMADQRFGPGLVIPPPGTAIPDLFKRNGNGHGRG